MYVWSVLLHLSRSLISPNKWKHLWGQTFKSESLILFDAALQPPTETPSFSFMSALPHFDMEISGDQCYCLCEAGNLWPNSFLHYTLYEEWSNQTAVFLSNFQDNFLNVAKKMGKKKKSILAKDTEVSAVAPSDHRAASLLMLWDSWHHPQHSTIKSIFFFWSIKQNFHFGARPCVIKWQLNEPWNLNSLYLTRSNSQV